MGDSSAAIDIGDIEISEKDDETEQTPVEQNTTPVENNTNNDNANNESVINKESPLSNGSAAVNKNTNTDTLAEATELFTTKRDGAVRINTEVGKCTMKPMSAMSYVSRTVNKYPTKDAMRVERDGKWISWTYQEYLEDIKTTAKAFKNLGLEKFNGVGILGFNSPEWLLSDLGAIYAGGLAVGIYTTNNAEMCQYIIEDACCNIVVVENDVQLQKILQVWDHLPHVKAIVQYTGEIKDKKPNMYTWNELMEMGRGLDDSLLTYEGIAPNKCCTLIYTSGTTGNPKGVMISHDNMISTASIAMAHVGLDPDQQRYQHQFVSYLPLSHVAAQLTDIWLPLYCGACISFAKPDALKGSLVDTLKQVRPTIFVGVPRVYEKIEEKLKSIGATITGFKKMMSTWAKGKCLEGNQNKEVGKPVPYGWTIASKLLKKVHRGLGFDRTEQLFTAAAPISKQTLEYFQSINLPVFELYGMSETAGPVTVNQKQKSRITSIGPIMEMCESKIANADEDGSGELCFRGRNIMMGYLNNEEKNAETLEEGGWIRSGDVGKVDEDGFFYITGRIKELIITAGGENIAPVPIEENIREEIPLIASAMVIGDKKKFLSCLLTPHVEIDKDTGLSTDKLLPIAVSYCKDIGLDVTKSGDISPNVPEALQKAIQAGIDRANKKAVSNATKVQKWKLLPLDFTTSGGELGPTQKLRRPHVMKMYKETVDEFYNV